jgi:hypothetical protein
MPSSQRRHLRLSLTRPLPPWRRHGWVASAGVPPERGLAGNPPPPATALLRASSQEEEAVAPGLTPALVRRCHPFPKPDAPPPPVCAPHTPPPPPAQCLVEKGGYVYLDVRPTLELDAVGKFRGCVNIPIMDARWVWDAEQGKKVVEKEDNLEFIAQVGPPPPRGVGPPPGGPRWGTGGGSGTAGGGVFEWGAAEPEGPGRRKEEAEQAERAQVQVIHSHTGHAPAAGERQTKARSQRKSLPPHVSHLLPWTTRVPTAGVPPARGGGGPPAR